jgi:hypothetical protein
MTDTPPDIADEASAAKQDLLPKKSGDLYIIENVDHKVQDLYFFASCEKKASKTFSLSLVNFFLHHCTIVVKMYYYNEFVIFSRMLCSSCGCLKNLMCTSAPPRLENPDSDKKDGLDTQITIVCHTSTNGFANTYLYLQASAIASARKILLAHANLPFLA